MTATTTSAAKLGLLAQLGADGVVMDGLDAVSVGEAVAKARPDVIVHQTTRMEQSDVCRQPLLAYRRDLVTSAEWCELAVIYLIYNEGYRGRVDLGAEAIRLGRVLTALMPDEPEAHGLLALMMIHHARRRARFTGEDLVLLHDQDRSLWDMPQIAAGRAVLDRAIALGGRGAYVAQAAVASLQTRERIDWPQVAEMYRRLVDLTGSPVVELNRAVALAQAGDPAAALRAVDRLDLDGYLYFHSTRGELQRRLGRDAEARAAYRPGHLEPRAVVPDPAARTALTRLSPGRVLVRRLGMSDNLAHLPRELHSRTSVGIQVSLWWSPADGRTWVAVRDVRTDAGFVLPVLAGERARDVFDHPYAHAARRGVPTTARAA